MRKQRLLVLSLIPLLSAVTINSVLPTGGTGNLSGSWSQSSVWIGGAIPGSSDTANVQSTGLHWTIAYDAAAPSPIGSLHSNSLVLNLQKPLTVNGNLGLREGTLHDNGHDVTILGTFSNSAQVTNNGNGGGLVRGGGHYSFNNLDLQRATSFTLTSGDVINGNYTTLRAYNSWPDLRLAQNTGVFPADGGIGITFEDPNATISLGFTNAGDQSEIIMNWDPIQQSGVDWILRWKGNHVTIMNTWYSNGQLVVGTIPAGVTFDPAKYIFYDANDDYTYVGLKPDDSDGDGVNDVDEECDNDPSKTVEGFCGCNWIDLDLDITPGDETCVHETAFVSPLATLQPGAEVDQNAFVAPRAVIGSSGIVGPNSVVSRRAQVLGTIGNDVYVARAAVVGAGATVGDGTTIGYASDIQGSSLGENAIIGSLVTLTSPGTYGDNVVIARNATLGTGADIADNTVIGPFFTAGTNADIDLSVRIRKNVTLGDDVHLKQGCKIGRSSAIGAVGGAASTVGEDARLRANVTVPADHCVADDATITRDTTVNNTCP